MDYEITCYVAFGSLAPAGHHRDILLAALGVFQDILRRANMGYTLDVYSLREGRTIVQLVNTGEGRRHE